MKVLILGATGGVGRHAVRLALAAGHTVTAVARGPADFPADVQVIRDEVLRPGVVEEASRGQDAILSCLGLRRRSSTPWSDFEIPDLTSRSAKVITGAMQRNGVRRTVAVSASGVGDSRPGLNAMMRAFIRFTNVGAFYADLEEMERIYAQTGLDICCVRPTGLKDGPQTGRVVRLKGFPLGALISRADVAAFMVERLAGDADADRFPTISEGR